MFVSFTLLLLDWVLKLQYKATQNNIAITYLARQDT